MLGIALVADDIRKGPKLAFSYPLSSVELSHRAGKSDSSISSAAAQSGPSGSKPRDAKAGDPQNSAGQNETAAADYFARLFRPKPSLCNAPFIVTVDNTVFISYPIIVPIVQPSRTGVSVTGGATSLSTAEDGHAFSRASGIVTQPQSTAQTPAPNSNIADKPWKSSYKLGDETDLDFLPAASAAATNDAASGVTDTDDSRKQTGTTTGATGSRAALSMFNVVFIVDPSSHVKRRRRKRGLKADPSISDKADPLLSSPPLSSLPLSSPLLSSPALPSPPLSFADSDFSDYLEEILSELEDEEARQLLLDNCVDCCQRVAAAMWYEEKRCAYVTKQASAMMNTALNIKDRVLAPSTAPAAGSLRRAPSMMAEPLAATARSASFTQQGSDEKGSNNLSASTLPPAGGLTREGSLGPSSTSTGSLPMTSASTKALIDSLNRLDAAKSPLGLSICNDTASLSEIWGFEAHPLLAFSLGWELAYIFHSLWNGLGSVCHLKLNGWLSLSLSLSAYSPNKANSFILGDFSTRLDDDDDSRAALQTVYKSLSKISSGQTPSLDPPTPSAAIIASIPKQVRPTLWQGAHYRTPEAKMMPIRPYHTLLLLRDTEQVLRILPVDAAPQTVQLICAATPLRSFNELQGETGIPSSQLLRLAAHLVHWGIAIIANVITNHNVYTVSPTADISISSPKAVEFEALFGGSKSSGFSLASVLSLFSKVTYSDIHTAATAATTGRAPISAFALQPAPQSVPSTPYMGGSSTFMSGPPLLTKMQNSDRRGGSSSDPLSSAATQTFVATTGTGIPLRTLMEAMPQARASKFIDILTWLLKHGYLRQMHTYIYLMWPYPLHRYDDTLTSAITPTARRGQQAAVQGASPTGAGTASAVPWAPEELQYLQDLCKSKPAPLVPLFRRLVSYLRDTMASFGPSFDSIALEEGAYPGIMMPDDTDIFDFDGMSPILKLGLRLEEIMWRLHMARADLLQVLSAFPEVLITSMHD